jgi:hypothetical protein
MRASVLIWCLIGGIGYQGNKGDSVTLMKYLPHKMATLPLTQPGMNHEISS